MRLRTVDSLRFTHGHFGPARLPQPKVPQPLDHSSHRHPNVPVAQQRTVRNFSRRHDHRRPGKNSSGPGHHGQRLPTDLRVVRKRGRLPARQATKNT